MQAIVLQDDFGLENLTVAERPDPEPGPGEVLLEVLSTSLNYRDWLMVRGQYDPRLALPMIPLSDGVGRVAAVGPGVHRVQVGDRVAATFFQSWIAGKPERQTMRATLGGPLDGMLTQKVVLSQEGVVRVPEHLSDAEAATLPCAALTAWSALVEEGGLVAGETVLIQGTGGVSLFALQFAKLFSAEVVVTSSSDEKLERARELGAHHCINYTSDENWGKTARKLTGGVDHIIEVGGAGTLDQSLHAVKPGGHIALIGILSGTRHPVELTRILMNKLRVQGILVGHRDAFEAMNRAISVSQLRPVIDKGFSFGQAGEALEYLASGKHFGKISVQVG